MFGSLYRAKKHPAKSGRFFICAYLVAVICVGLGQCCADEVDESDAASVKDRPGKAELELKMEGRPDSPVLVVMLRNTGDDPITVDRELVFLVYIIGIDREGDLIWPEERRTLPKPKRDAASWKKRFVTLMPGQTVSRRVEIHNGFKTFVLVSTYSSGGVHKMSPGYEAIERLPLETALEKLEVYYGTPPFFVGMFERYTGLDTTSLNLFMGRLRSEIAVKSLLRSHE